MSKDIQISVLDSKGHIVCPVCGSTHEELNEKELTKWNKNIIKFLKVINKAAEEAEHVHKCRPRRKL